MSQSLFTAVSGLKNHQVWLDVVGNNIANANTPGFKASNVVFSDILSQTISGGGAATGTTGGTNPVQVGLGATIGSISPNFVQGALQITNRNTDLAIQGDGFFVLANGSDRLYGRAGAFSLDATGTLVDSGTGFKVQGAAGDIVLTPGQQIPAVATSTALFKGNLDATSTDGTTHVATFNIRDSLGGSHTLTVTFTKNFAAAPGRWDWAVTEADTSITSLTTPTGSVTFNGAGAVTAGASQAVGLVYAAAAGVNTPQSITLDFGTATNTAPMTGFAGPSTGTLASQNGQPSGSLQSFTIGDNGTISGLYSNGQTRILNTVQLATFNNPAGLLKVGENYYREGTNSGTASVGNPTTGGRGSLAGGALESSNVDLAFEFSNMIIAERGFQANARTITTVNKTLEEAVNLVR